MIKAALTEIESALQKIVNAIFCLKYYPSELKQGIIVNLFKSGSVNSTDNYSGLTINSCLAKVFNTIINKRLSDFLEKNSVISDTKIGFKKKARTSDHLFIVNTVIRKFRGLKRNVFACFVDFRKAYDRVWREALKYKLMYVCGH